MSMTISKLDVCPIFIFRNVKFLALSKYFLSVSSDECWGYRYIQVRVNAGSLSLRKKRFSENTLTFCSKTLYVQVREKSERTSRNAIKSDVHTMESLRKATTTATRQGHPTSIFGKYLFGRRFEI